MTVLSAQSIHNRVGVNPGLIEPEKVILIEPYLSAAKQFKGMSYGLTAAGYDIRLGKIRHPDRDNVIVESCWLLPGKFLLAASLERLAIPNDLQVIVHDKSSWARQGLALQNTVLEPGWFGYITLELSNHGSKGLHLMTGMPIAQLIFHQLDEPTTIPYKGKYQDQDDTPNFAKEATDD